MYNDPVLNSCLASWQITMRFGIHLFVHYNVFGRLPTNSLEFPIKGVRSIFCLFGHLDVQPLTLHLNIGQRLNYEMYVPGHFTEQALPPLCWVYCQ